MAISASLIGRLGGGGSGEAAIGAQVGGFPTLARKEWVPVVPTDTHATDGITITSTGFLVPAGDYRVQMLYRGGRPFAASFMWARIQVGSTTWADHEDAADDSAFLTATGTLATDGEIRAEINAQSSSTADRAPRALALAIIRTG